MKKLISILIVMLALMILCTACDPAVNGGADPKVLDTYEKYAKALDDVLNADKTGKLVYMYATENTPCGVETGVDYSTPKFFATVEGAIKFDEYTVKMKMKDELKYVYIYNSKHYDSAMDDAYFVQQELKKENNK